MMPLFPQPKLIIWYRLISHKENSRTRAFSPQGDLQKHLTLNRS
jgi:hypothetical protein